MPPAITISLRDHVIVPGWRYEALIKLEQCVKLGLLQWRDGSPEATVAQSSVSEPPPTRPDASTRRTIFGTPPGFEAQGNAAAEEAAILKRLGVTEEPEGSDDGSRRIESPEES